MDKPTEWQQDPQNIKTDKVQFWRDGIMVTAQMTQKRARAIVEAGIAYVISAQAVGVLGLDDNRRG